MVNIITDTYEFSEKPNGFFEKLIIVSRNTKVVKGGRVFGFSALSVVGDRNGKVGVGRGKAKEVPFAIQKSLDNARSKLVFVNINNGTIYHKICIKYCATKIVMLPASEGTGIISSFIMRSIFEAVGIKSIFAKCFGSTNPNNIANGVIKGLLEMSEKIKSNSFRNSCFKKNK